MSKIKNLFNIIMPVYNTDLLLLKKAINSVLNQTFKDFRLIIVNDGSTKVEVNNYLDSLNDPKIIYKKINNSGPSVARNKGLEMVDSQYFMFLDSDDYFIDTALEELANFIRKTGNKLILFDFESKNRSKFSVKKLNSSHFSREYILKCPKIMNEFSAYSVIWNKCYHITFLNHRFDERTLMGEDRVYLYELYTDNNFTSLGILDRKLYFYNLTTGSLTKTNNYFIIKKVYLFLSIMFKKINKSCIFYSYYLNTLNFEVIFILNMFMSIKNYKDLKKDEFFRKIMNSDEINSILENRKHFYNGINNEIRFILIKFKLFKLYNILFKIRAKIGK